MTDAPTASLHACDREIAHYRRLISEAESAEIEARERRSYSVEPGDVLIWTLTIPVCLVFLGACVWAIATNG